MEEFIYTKTRYPFATQERKNKITSYSVVVIGI